LYFYIFFFENCSLHINSIDRLVTEFTHLSIYQRNWSLSKTVLSQQFSISGFHEISNIGTGALIGANQNTKPQTFVGSFDLETVYQFYHFYSMGQRKTPW